MLIIIINDTYFYFPYVEASFFLKVPILFIDWAVFILRTIRFSLFCDTFFWQIRSTNVVLGTRDVWVVEIQYFLSEFTLSRISPMTKLTDISHFDFMVNNSPKSNSIFEKIRYVMTLHCVRWSFAVIFLSCHLLLVFDLRLLEAVFIFFNYYE